MARTNLPLSPLVASGADLNDAGTAIDQVNGMIVAISPAGIPASGSLERVLLYVQNTTAATETVTVRKGVGGGVTPGQAFESGKGDLVTGNLTATTGSAFIGPFEVARFIQLDGSLWVDFSSGMTGKIWALLLPRAF